MTHEFALVYLLEEEPKILSMPFWLSGLFEATGTITFGLQGGVRRGRTRTYAYPKMELTDNSHERILGIKNLAGGVARKLRISSWTWGLYGEKVVPLAEVMTGKAPSREETLRAILNWESADLEERVEIANQILGQSVEMPTNQESYKWLVNRPEFVAGVIDAKALFRQGRMSIYSINLALLSALKEKHGGAIWLQTPRGEYQKPKFREGAIRMGNNFYGLKLDVNQLKNLLREVEPFLQLRRSMF